MRKTKNVNLWGDLQQDFVVENLNFGVDFERNSGSKPNLSKTLDSSKTPNFSKTQMQKNRKTTPKKQISSEKSFGRFYTPPFIVESILELSGYKKEKIRHKHVMDNSCGDGAFLVQIVERYCLSAKEQGASVEELKSELERFIHGIEIDQNECQKCVFRVSEVAKKFGVCGVKWDIFVGDSLCMERFDGVMDFVLGNPPYVRVHNLGNSFETIKKFEFAKGGMTDLFIVFYEIGLKMLKKDGVLGYITPSSFFASVAGERMRAFFVANANLRKVVDLGHFQAFKNSTKATTYTAIIVLQKTKSGGFGGGFSCGFGSENKFVNVLKKEKNITQCEAQHEAQCEEQHVAQHKIAYFKFDETSLKPVFIENLKSDEFYIDGKFYFADKNSLNLLKKIFYNTKHSDILVKNGYATLCDEIFVGDFAFNSPFLIPVLKASSGVWQQIFYPYDTHGKLVSEERLAQESELYAHLKNHKTRLENRDIWRGGGEKCWFAFGRTQALSDTYKPKLALNSLIKVAKELKICAVKSGEGVYGGLYITSTKTKFDEIERALRSDEFSRYVSLLGKYKNGGYFTFSSKDVKAFLDYFFTKNKKTFDKFEKNYL